MDDLVSRREVVEIHRGLYRPRPKIISDASWDSALDTATSHVMDLEPKHIRTGHWVRIGGYSDPDDGSVWACSECARGIHTYGGESANCGTDVSDHQWVACPNCGAVMEDNSGRSVD